MDILTVEDIKKIFDNFEVEGFEYRKQHSDSDYDIIYITEFSKSYWYIANIKQWGYYPHFLTRVIEGINKKSNIMIDQTSGYISSIYFNLKTKTQHPEGFDLSVFTPDQAKTKAIKYILEQL
jgi:hypothetical protein